VGSAECTREEAWRADIRQAQAGDRTMRDQLVTRNMGLVYMVAKRFGNRGADMEELTQIGSIGLIKAIDHFDPELPYSFSTYAVPLIMGEIRRFLRDDGMIHISRQVKEHARKIATVREEMKKTENKEPTLEELRQKTGLSMEELVLAMEATAEIVSISKPICEKEGKTMTLEEHLEDQNHFEDDILNHTLIKEALSGLKKEEENLIRMRYLQNLTQAEVARRLKTNQVAVSRMERKVLGKLRQRCN
jgi:RNA polymerase sporulation-specific sigma factor